MERFELQKDGQLKLFYNQGRDYLLFRDGLSLVSSTPSAELLGKWTLAEIRYSALPPVVFKPGEQPSDEFGFGQAPLWYRIAQPQRE